MNITSKFSNNPVNKLLFLGMFGASLFLQGCGTNPHSNNLLRDNNDLKKNNEYIRGKNELLERENKFLKDRIEGLEERVEKVEEIYRGSVTSPELEEKLDNLEGKIKDIEDKKIKKIESNSDSDNGDYIQIYPPIEEEKKDSVPVFEDFRNIYEAHYAPLPETSIPEFKEFWENISDKEKKLVFDVYSNTEKYYRLLTLREKKQYKEFSENNLDEEINIGILNAYCKCEDEGKEYCAKSLLKFQINEFAKIIPLLNH